jgi:hypothetical protein
VRRPTRPEALQQEYPASTKVIVKERGCEAR